MSSSADWPCTCGHAFEDHDDNKDTHCREPGCDCLAYRPQARPMTRASDDGQAGVVISWRDCDCEWATKYCDEEHVKYAVVSRSGLAALATAEEQQ